MSDPQFVQGQKYNYEHVATVKEIITFHPIWNEIKIITAMTGMLWQDDKAVYVTTIFLSPSIIDDNWVVIGEL